MRTKSIVPYKEVLKHLGLEKLITTSSATTSTFVADNLSVKAPGQKISLLIKSKYNVSCQASNTFVMGWRLSVTTKQQCGIIM